jgi:hypothetical protein
MLCRERGIELERFTLHLADTRITGNVVLGCRDAALVIVGGNSADGTVDISDNLCHVQASGIVVGLDEAGVTGNDVRALAGEALGDGITLAPGLDPIGIEHCMVLGNRIRGVRGHGIAIRTRVDSGMIKHNVIAETGGGGIVMEGDGAAGSLVVENNQLLGIAGALRGGKAHVAMLFVSVDHLDVVGNLVHDFAREIVNSGLRSAIAVAATGSTRADTNRVIGVAPPPRFGGAAIGVHVVPPFTSVEATGNRVRRRGRDEEKIGTGLWIGILIGTPDREPPGRGFFALGDVAVAATGKRSFVLSGTRIRAAERDPGDVALRGNTVEAEASEHPPVFVSLAHAVRFSDNQIARIGADGGESSFLRCVRAVVNANDLRDRIEQEVLRVEITGKGAAAILGNLVSGPITLNGTQVPMDLLNPFSFE